MQYHIGSRPSNNIPWFVYNADLPQEFTVNDWAVSVSTIQESDLDLVIFNLPDQGGLIIQDIEYRINGGQAISLGTQQTGSYIIENVISGNVIVVELRIITRKGAGPWSDVKNVGRFDNAYLTSTKAGAIVREPNNYQAPYQITSVKAGAVIRSI